MNSNVATAAIGSVSISSLVWWSWLSSGLQIIVAIGGAVLIGLTIYNKILEIKQRKRDLK